MVLNIDDTGSNAFGVLKKALTVDPTPLIMALNEQDERLYFAFCISRQKFLYTNNAFDSFFGQLSNINMAKSFLHFVSAEDADYLTKCYKELQPGIAKNNIEFNICLPDKEYCRLRLTLILQSNPGGDRAITGYAEKIAQAVVYQEVFEEYHSKKKKILNILSHDLLSPMGSIHNLAALLSRKSALQKDPETNKWLSLIEVISKKSINLIRTFVEKEFVEPGTGAIATKQYPSCQNTKKA